MREQIVTFTDFGIEGPYLGQVKAMLLREAPGLPVIDLMADAPSFDPMAASYLLAALVPEMPEGAVMLCVVDPGVGGSRDAVVAEIDGRMFVGPDNGLFEPVARRAESSRCWRIDWRPRRLSSSFHGRDLFAPVAARLASGASPEEAGCSAMPMPARPDWPDDLARIVYIDRYGNAMTGLRGAGVAADAKIAVGDHRLSHADRFEAATDDEGFWYVNSCGLVEIAFNRASAAKALGLVVGQNVDVEGCK